MIKPITFIYELEEIMLEFSKTEPLVLVLAQYGSRVNNTFDLLSDLDYFILTDEIKKIQDKLKTLSPYHIINYQERCVLYFKSKYHEFDIRKVDVMLSNQILDLKKFLKKSDDPSKIILIDKIGASEKNFIPNNETEPEEIIQYHINRFVEAFENGSTANQSSDRYRFLFHQSIALQHLYILEYMNNGYHEFDYLPKQFTKSLPEEVSSLLMDEFDPISDLKKGRLTRLNLLNKFKAILQRLDKILPDKINSNQIINFLEEILKRDWIWNIRDIADVNPKKLNSNIMLRSSSLSFYKLDEEMIDLTSNFGVHSIIDLRFAEEIEASKYETNSFDYYNIPIGAKHIIPHNLKYTTIGQDPFFYEYFPRYYHEEILEILKSIIIAPKPAVLHCYAGKDRTGIIVAMIHKLCGLSDQEIIMDYISSRSDTEKKKIQITLTLISEFGGIKNYLQRIGLDDDDILTLIQLFRKP